VFAPKHAWPDKIVLKPEIKKAKPCALSGASSCWLHTYLNMPILTHLTKFISMAEMAKARGAFISNPGSAMKYRRTGT
jgi:hypothetical protein